MKRIATLAAVACVATAALPGVAGAHRTTAGRSVSRTAVQPAKPASDATLTVSFRTGAHAAAGQQYAVEVQTQKRGACRSHAVEPAAGTAGPNTRVTVSLAAGEPGSGAHWCSGKAIVSALRRVHGAWITVPGTRRVITVRSVRTPSAPFGTKVAVDVLPSSTATVTAPGRATRVLTLGGGISGLIPGKLKLNTDYAVRLGGILGAPGNRPYLPDALWLRTVVVDPLCASPAIQTGMTLTPSGPSVLTFRHDGGVSGTLELAGDATALAGCAGPVTGTTKLTLTGKLGAKQLADVELTAKLTGVPVGGGVTGEVAIDLHLNVMILDS